MREGNEDEKLNNAIKSSPELAIKAFKSISMPVISSRIFGFPKDRYVKILVNETINFLIRKENSMNIVEFHLLNKDTISEFQKEFDKVKTMNFKYNFCLIANMR